MALSHPRSHQDRVIFNSLSSLTLPFVASDKSYEFCLLCDPFGLFILSSLSLPPLMSLPSFTCTIVIRHCHTYLKSLPFLVHALLCYKVYFLKPRSGQSTHLLKGLRWLLRPWRLNFKRLCGAFRLCFSSIRTVPPHLTLTVPAGKAQFPLLLGLCYSSV